MDGMIDLETLGVDDDSVILTLGAVKFNPYADAEPHSGLYLHCSIEEQTDVLGRTVDDNTLEWWSKQDPKAQEEAFGDSTPRVSVEDMLSQLSKWCVALDFVWAQGVMFDFGKLEHIYKQAGKPVPWAYYQVQDSRTLLNRMPYDPRKDMQQDLHNALSDAYYQARAVQVTHEYFGMTRR